MTHRNSDSAGLRARSSRGSAQGVFLSLTLACQAVLGIEDLEEGPRPNADGGGSGGAVGESASAGAAGESSGGSAGDGPSGGAAGSALGMAGSASVLPEPLPDGGVPDGGGVGNGIVVAGRVIDFFRRPVPDTPVTIGGATAVTNAAGEFSISGVAPPYTASLIINMIRGGGQARYGYRYEGLTRADPTLQVYSALTERSATSLSVSFDNDFPEGLYAIVAYGSPDGRFVDEESTGNTEFLGSPAWTGPVSIGGNIHALRAGRDVSDEPPVAFEAYQSFPLTVTDNQPASVTFDLSSSASLTVGAIAGSVSGGAFDTQSNYVGLRFGDGTALPIVNDTPDLPDFFSYFVPLLEDSSFFVAASDGSSGFPPYGVTHQENIELGDSEIALALPRPVTLTSPPDGGAVTPTTPYAWSTLSQTAQTFLWHLELDSTYEGMFVLTSRTQIELPEFEGITISPGLAATWSVETHGDAPDVDALTGPDGYLDAYSLGTAFPIGPNHSDGYYTESERHGFIMGSD
jgi:hypothetical protein